MANNHCPHLKDMKELQKGRLLCTVLGKNVKIKKGRCICNSCSKKR